MREGRCSVGEMAPVSSLANPRPVPHSQIFWVKSQQPAPIIHALNMPANFPDRLDTDFMRRESTSLQSIFLFILAMLSISYTDDVI